MHSSETWIWEGTPVDSILDAETTTVTRILNFNLACQPQKYGYNSIQVIFY
jgi:phage-related protein